MARLSVADVYSPCCRAAGPAPAYDFVAMHRTVVRRTLAQHSRERGLGEGPVEWPGGGVVAVFEVEESLNRLRCAATWVSPRARRRAQCARRRRGGPDGRPRTCARPGRVSGARLRETRSVRAAGTCRWRWWTCRWAQRRTPHERIGVHVVGRVVELREGPR